MFRNELHKKISGSLYNHYGADNHDKSRFGKYVPAPVTFKTSVFDFVKGILHHKADYFTNKKIEIFESYLDRLQRIWEELDSDSRAVLVELVAYRLLGYTKVKLSTNNAFYKHALKHVNALVKDGQTIDPHFLHYVLNHYDLRKAGYDIELFYSPAGIVVDFMLEQYCLKKNGQPFIGVEAGDYVIDAGGCWGDTALYFASKAGENGKVFSFEFIPGNIEIFQKNIALNPHLSSRIELVPQPVSGSSGQKMYFKDFGPGSMISHKPFEGETGETSTISIDDFVNSNRIEKLDFIKMDIEGAEPSALLGSIETIKKFRPKLAIAIYHSPEDFVNIPNWILDQNLGYEIHLGHYTIHEEETVLFCKPKKS